MVLLTSNRFVIKLGTQKRAGNKNREREVMTLLCFWRDLEDHLSHSEVPKSPLKSLCIDELKKDIYFTLKIPVKIKLHNPFSLNNFTITDKRLCSVKQVTQNITERGFSEVRIILYAQLNLKYSCLILNMQHLNIECVRHIQSVYWTAKGTESGPYDIFLLFNG